MSQSKRRTGSGFRTDADISRAKARHGERELKPWVPDGPAEGVSAGGLDDETFGAGSSRKAGNAGEGGGGGGGGGGWDQFATNARLFGATTTYDEDLYTTRLDRTQPGFRDRESRAEVLAREIEQGVSANVHVMEERGHDVGGEGWDEEARFSGVKRSGTAAYVPPGARGGDHRESKDAVKAGAGKPAVFPAASNVAQPLKPTVAPASNATSATKTTTVKPTTTPAAAAAAAPAPAPASAAAPENTMTDSLRRFAQLEREKIAQAKVDIAKTERERRLAELKAFGKSFKVPVRVGGAGAGAGAAAGTGAGAEAKSSVAAGAAEAKVGERPASNKPASAAPAPVKPKISMRIPEIPPFKGASAAPPKVEIPATADRAVPEHGKDEKKDDRKKDQAKSTAAVAAAAAPTLNPAAAAFSFKPNPAASSFTPGAPAVAGVKAPNGHIPSAAPLKSAQSHAMPPLPSAAAAHVAAPPPIQQVPPRHPFFIIPPKRVPGVNVRDEFNPMRSRRATKPEETPMVWQYSGRRVLSSLHAHQQSLQPSGMYQLHMNGVHPVHAPIVGAGGIPIQGPPIVPPGAQMMQANAALSPARTGTTIEDERISPGPAQPGALPTVPGAAAAGVPPGVLPYQPGGPGPAMGPGGFAPYRGPQMQHMGGQPGMFAQYPGNGGVFMGNPMMQGMPYNPQMMGNGPMRPPGYYPQLGMTSGRIATSPMPHSMAPHAPP